MVLLSPYAAAAEPDVLDLAGHIPLAAYVEPVAPTVLLSPDGRSRARYQQDDAATFSFWVGPVDGGAPDRRLADGGYVVSWPTQEYVLAWFRDAEKPTASHWPLYRLDVRDGSRVRVESEDEELVWIGDDRAHPGSVLLQTPGKHTTVYRYDVAADARSVVWEGRAHGRLLFDDTSGDVVGAIDFRVIHGDETAPRWVRRQTFSSIDATGRVEPVFTVKDPLYVSLSTPSIWAHAGRLFVIVQLDTDTPSLQALDLATGAREVIQEAEAGAVVGGLSLAPGAVVAVMEQGARTRWTALDPSVAPDFARLAAALAGDFAIVERRADTWLLRETAPTHAPRWFTYDRSTGALARLGEGHPAFDAQPWRPMEALSFPAADGLPLTAYLTTPDPARHGPAPWPVVVRVHGGPRWARESWGWDFDTQRLADLGYAVLSVNFRGGGGFGARFEAAGEGEWGGRMSTDLLDALAFAAATGTVDLQRAAIDGGSYGGYAALAAVTVQPGGAQPFRCAVSQSGEGSLLRRSVFGAMTFRELGPRAMRLERSPDQHVDALDVPVLVWVGARDLVVPWAQVSRFVGRARAADKALVLVRDRRAGHGPSDAPGWNAWTAVRENFLARCLGGAAPPLAPALVGSGLRVVHGDELLGLDGQTDR